MAYLCLQATREGQASHAHVKGIVDGLRSLGWEVDLYQPGYSSSAEDPGLWPRLREFVRIQARLVRRIADYDLVYVRSHFAAFPTVVSARLRDVPVLREVNGTYRDLFLAWPQTRALAPVFLSVMRSQIRWSDGIIAVTDGLADWTREEGAAGPVRVVPNAADVGLFRPDASTGRDLPERFAIFFGALAPWQGVETLLEAVERPVWPDDVHLLIAGDGDVRERVEEGASRSERVGYLGTVPYRELPGVVARSVCGFSVHGSVENRGSTGLYPLKVFETMACGVPVVVTDHPGQADLVRTVECGLVVPPDDPARIAAAVGRLSSEPELAASLGRRGRRAAVEEHSWDDRARSTDRIVRECLGRASSREASQISF